MSQIFGCFAVAGRGPETDTEWKEQGHLYMVSGLFPVITGRFKNHLFWLGDNPSWCALSLFGYMCVVYPICIHVCRCIITD